MQRFLRFLLYSNIYIGICAAALTAVTQMWYGQFGEEWAYLGFIFFGTITLYGAHRLIGLRFIREVKGRFKMVLQLQEIIVIIAGASGLGAILCFSQLPVTAMKGLILPMALSILYVTPVFPGRKRLRDIPYIKILVLSFVWAWLTHHIPAQMYGVQDYLDSGLFFERFVFILAITIPFDIRDYHIDQEHGVKTLVGALGVKGAKALAQVALFAGVLSLTSISLEHPPFSTSAFACIGGYLSAYILIILSNTRRSDLYYLLGLDGTMLLLFLGNFFFH